MSATSKSNRKILIAVMLVSIVILIMCLIQLSVYYIESSRRIAKNNGLYNKLGGSNLVLSVDEATGEPCTVSLSVNTSGSGNLSDSIVSSPDDAAAPVSSYSVLDKYQELYHMNRDIAGWIAIDDTHINYPVMQNIYDEEKYLHRDFYGEYDKAGLPFLDSRCVFTRQSTNLLIYGHNMKNGEMFHDLLKYKERSFYEDHKYIRFDTVYEEGFYEIIAVFKSYVSYENEQVFKFYNFIEADFKEEFDSYIDNVKALSIYPIDVDIKYGDCLLTLTTCEYSTDDGRFVVVAKKIQ